MRRPRPPPKGAGARAIARPSPDFAERVARLGYTPRPTEPEWFREFLRGQIETLTRQAREAGLEQSG